MKKNLFILLVFISLLIYFYFNKDNSIIQNQQEKNVANIQHKSNNIDKISIEKNIIKKDTNHSIKPNNVRTKNSTLFLEEDNNTDLDDLPLKKEFDMDEINMAINMAIDPEIDEELLISISNKETMSQEEMEDLIEDNDIEREEEIKNIIKKTTEFPKIPLPL